MKKLSRPEAVILALFVVFCIGLMANAGCSNTSPSSLKSQVITNTRGQYVTFVEGSKLTAWIRDNPDLRLIALTGYAAGDMGTSGYVIIYETPQAERQ